MKLANALAVLALLFCSCSSNGPNANDTAEAAPIVGSNTDEHGCNRTAGMQWSTIRNECIAIFQAGIRLAPVDSFMDKNSAAFVVFKSDIDDVQLELFIPKHEETIIVEKVKDDTEGTWKNDDYMLTKSKGVYTLMDSDNRTLFQGTTGR